MEFLTPTTPLKLSKSFPTSSSLTPSVKPLNLSSTFTSIHNQCVTPEKQTSHQNIKQCTNSNQKNSSQKLLKKSDRFIPNRNRMDFSYCNYNLFCDVGKTENEDEDCLMTNSNKKQKSNEKLMSSQNRLKEEVFQLANHTPGKRMLSCFDQCDEEPITPVVKVFIHFPSSLTLFLIVYRGNVLLANHPRRSFELSQLHPPRFLMLQVHLSLSRLHS